MAPRKRQEKGIGKIGKYCISLGHPAIFSKRDPQYFESLRCKILKHRRAFADAKRKELGDYYQFPTEVQARDVQACVSCFVNEYRYFFDRSRYPNCPRDLNWIRRVLADMMTAQEKASRHHKKPQARKEPQSLAENAIHVEQSPRTSVSSNRRHSSSRDFEDDMKAHLDFVYPLENTEDQIPDIEWAWQPDPNWPTSFRPFGFRYIHDYLLYNVKSISSKHMDNFLYALRRQLQIPHGMNPHQQSMLRDKCFDLLQTSIQRWMEKGLLTQSQGLIRRCSSFENALNTQREKWLAAAQKSCNRDQPHVLPRSPSKTTKRNNVERSTSSTSEDDDSAHLKKLKTSKTKCSPPQQIYGQFSGPSSGNANHFASRPHENLQQPEGMPLYHTEISVQPMMGFSPAQSAPVANMRSPQEFRSSGLSSPFPTSFRGCIAPDNLRPEFRTQASLNAGSHHASPLPVSDTFDINLGTNKSPEISATPIDNTRHVEISPTIKQTTRYVSEVDTSPNLAFTHLLAPPFEFDDIRNRRQNSQHNCSNNKLGDHTSTSPTQAPTMDFHTINNFNNAILKQPSLTSNSPNTSMASPGFSLARPPPFTPSQQQTARIWQEPNNTTIPHSLNAPQPKIATSISTPKKRISLSFIVEASKGEPNLNNPITIQEFRDATRTQFIDMVVARRSALTATDDILRVRFIPNWGSRSPTVVYNRCADVEWERKRDEVRRKCEFRRDVLMSRGLGGDLTVWVEVDLGNATSSAGGGEEDVVEEDEWE